jgi:metallophosphoesterase (TIGR00282 family)
VRILFLGDIFARTGRELVGSLLRPFMSEEGVDLALANGENAAGGLGLTADTAKELLGHGLSALSGGNHTFRNKEMETFLESEADRLIRPANYPPPCPGRGWTMLEEGENGQKVAFGNLMGRIYMGPGLDCPFRAADAMLEEMGEAGALITIIDFHAEATSEKKAMAFYLDGRLGALLGTHTHVQTSDADILPKGTAYMTDAGMTGPHLSAIGMGHEEVLRSILSGRLSRFKPAKEGGAMEGALMDFDERGKALSIKAVRLKAPEASEGLS